ncbi:MAG: glycosyltransferase family 2 protein [Alphaproteobacteria bacterium]|nr:glycosyltransferase family 2 protein [Alphaproteobacteria bacterium]MCB9692922.1 glycosyltransferase family 2 protein [Alphaproteobacteria bacterium]
METERSVAVVIPCYRVTAHVLDVIARIGPWCDRVYCVDDACPDRSGDHIEAHCTDPRVRVLRREANGGVGAATMTGYQAGIDEGMDVLVKIDGDGQMDPAFAPRLVAPILLGEADYTKGNRFFSPATVAAMPPLRLVGNAGLSFMTKLSTGYWDLMDPTNGYTALHAAVARELPFDRIHPRYFFESDVLFRLATLRARVVELPLVATYADERSNLSELNALLTFPPLHARNFVKRIFYGYFLRNFSAASLSLVIGLGFLAFGVSFGSVSWATSSSTQTPSTAGTVMLAGLPVFLGIQLLLSFLQHDVASVPRDPLHRRIEDVRITHPSGATPGTP